MRVVVDPKTCEGNGVCVRAAPEVFRLRDDDVADVLIGEPPEALRPKVEAAVRGCPRRAIRLEG
jgi:ferredoxin